MLISKVCCIKSLQPSYTSYTLHSHTPITQRIIIIFEVIAVASCSLHNVYCSLRVYKHIAVFLILNTTLLSIIAGTLSVFWEHVAEILHAIVVDRQGTLVQMHMASQEKINFSFSQNTLIIIKFSSNIYARSFHRIIHGAVEWSVDIDYNPGVVWALRFFEITYSNVESEII